MRCSLITLLTAHLQTALLLVARASAYLTAEGDVVIPGASSYNGLNLVPQMGWNTW
jgi:alpha-galactosidase